MDNVVDVPKKSFLPTTIICMGLIWIGLMLTPDVKIKCSSSSKVVDILSLNGNNAEIKLENGKIISVNKAKLKKGDIYCTSYSKKI